MSRPQVRHVPADLETPVTVFLKLRPHGAWFLLESVEHGERLGRYSFIGCGNRVELKLWDDRLQLRRDGRERTLGLHGRDPLAELAKLVPAAATPGLPALWGGAVGYLSYDYARFLERLPRRLPEELGLPLAHFAIADDLAVFDHVARRLTLIARDRARLAQLARALEQPAVLPPRDGPRRLPRFSFATRRGAFLSAVRRAKQYIRAGDIIQVVLSHRAHCRLAGSPFQIYRALRILNPSPYMLYLDFGGYQIVGSSPEVQVKLQDGTATVRPIAGTRRRGRTREEDLALEQELLADPKERAEHLMLIDLARNDVGRVCEYGSVRVSDLYAIERYSTVMHIVSEVGGRLRRDVSPVGLLGATFPAGTVAGAPKIRAMQIIEELEQARRGPYAGAVGYLGAGGTMDFCITIRTAVVKGRTAYLQAGAGIVADSDPAREWDETLNKMASLRRAVELAETKL
jgi:anthranilate synthase component 1